MAQTAAQRQADYRKRRIMAGVAGNGEQRLNTWVSTGAQMALVRLARRDKDTMRAVLERLILAEDEAILAGLEAGSVEWEAYFGSVTQ
jgi:uncharacterized protein YhjY with autotransporter beta-barrel domain